MSAWSWRRGDRGSVDGLPLGQRSAADLLPGRARTATSSDGHLDRQVDASGVTAWPGPADTDAGTSTLDQHVRRAVALAELSRLVLDSD